MIADLCFDAPDAGGVRRARFIPRSSIPLAAACLVANGLRETLRELLGERCELTIGEPAAIGRAAWELLTRDAHCFLTAGRQTDIVLVVPECAARALVLQAFGEGEGSGAPVLSALELHAVERIAARCAAAFDPLCAERRGATQRVWAASIPACVAYFDVRLTLPVALEFGIGIVRELPDPGPAGAFPGRAAESRSDRRAGAIRRRERRRAGAPWARAGRHRPTRYRGRRAGGLEGRRPFYCNR